MGTGWEHQWEHDIYHSKALKVYLFPCSHSIRSIERDRQTTHTNARRGMHAHSTQLRALTGGNSGNSGNINDISHCDAVLLFPPVFPALSIEWEHWPTDQEVPT